MPLDLPEHPTPALIRLGFLFIEEWPLGGGEVLQVISLMSSHIHCD